MGGRIATTLVMPRIPQTSERHSDELFKTLAKIAGDIHPLVCRGRNHYCDGNDKGVEFGIFVCTTERVKRFCLGLGLLGHL